MTLRQELTKQAIAYWRTKTKLAYQAISLLQDNCDHKYEWDHSFQSNNEWDQFPHYTEVKVCTVCSNHIYVPLEK